MHEEPANNSNPCHEGLLRVQLSGHSSGAADMHRLFKAHATCTILSNVVMLEARSTAVNGLSTGPVRMAYLLFTMEMTFSTCLWTLSLSEALVDHGKTSFAQNTNYENEELESKSSHRERACHKLQNSQYTFHGRSTLSQFNILYLACFGKADHVFIVMP